MSDVAQAAEFAAEVALEFYVADKVDEVQSKYSALALGYYTMYAAQRNYYFNNFQISGEAPFATEQFGIPFYAPDYVGLSSFGGPTGYFPPGAWYLFNPELAARVGALGSTSVSGYWARYASRYTANGNSAALEISGTFVLDSASINDDWNSYMNRYEEHKRDVWNEKRWAGQMGSLSFGVKEAYTVERGMGTAFWEFDEAQGQLISADDTLMNGLATAMGYQQMQKGLREDLGTVPTYQSNAHDTSPFLKGIFPNG